MKQSTLKKYIGILTDIKQSGLSIKSYCDTNGICVQSIYNTINKLKQQHDEESEMVSELLSLYNEVTSKSSTSQVTSTEEVDSEDHVNVSYERDENRKIICYKYKIYKKNKPTLDGTLTREEMSKIMRLYTWYGDGLTARIVSREFPQFSLPDLKRIFKAFSIYKDNCPFAPHDVEEKSIEELRDIQLREKENSFLRKAEEDQIKNNEKLLKKYAQENIELKKQLSDVSNFKVELPEIIPYSIPEYQECGTSLNLYLSDIHLGSYTISGSLYDENRNYGFDEAKRRLTVVLDKLSEFDCFDNINLVLMGDNVDCCGFTGKTGRLDHTMPSNMDAREQGNKYIELMMWFIQSLVDSDREFTSNVRVFCVPEGNHGSTFEYMCNKALLATINAKYPKIETTLWDKYYGRFEQCGHVFYCLHGKDSAFMRKGMPLNLDDKTKVQLYEWLMNQGETSKNVHFIKGDLHSNSLSSCNICDYRNVLSLYGASDYSNYNFSRNAYGVSYDLFINNNIIRGTFENL